MKEGLRSSGKERGEICIKTDQIGTDSFYVKPGLKLRRREIRMQISLGRVDQNHENKQASSNIFVRVFFIRIGRLFIHSL